jgi:hypothetical protein
MFLIFPSLLYSLLWSYWASDASPIHIRRFFVRWTKSRVLSTYGSGSPLSLLWLIFLGPPQAPFYSICLRFALLWGIDTKRKRKGVIKRKGKRKGRKESERQTAIIINSNDLIKGGLKTNNTAFFKPLLPTPQNPDATIN